MIDNNDKDFLESLRTELDNSVNNLDAETRSSLNQLRQSAISRKGGHRYVTMSLPAGAILAGIIVLAILFPFPAEQVDTPGTINSSLIDDMEMLSSSEDIEFLENLDFYEWLDEYEPQV